MAIIAETERDYQLADRLLDSAIVGVVEDGKRPRDGVLLATISSGLKLVVGEYRYERRSLLTPGRALVGVITEQPVVALVRDNGNKVQVLSCGEDIFSLPNGSADEVFDKLVELSVRRMLTKTREGR